MNLPSFLRTARAKATAAGTAGCVAAVTGLVALTGGPALAVVDDFGPGDGLNRFVVTLDDTSAPLAPTSDGIETTVGFAGAELTSSVVSAVPGALGADSDDLTVRGALDLTMLREAQAQLGTGGQIVPTADGVYYVVGDKAAPVSVAAPPVTVAPQAAPAVSEPASAVPADTPAPAVEPDPVAEPAAPSTISPEALDALAHQPGVVSVQPLEGDTALLATSLELSAVRDLPGVATAVESVQLPVAADATDPYYKAYGWNLHNTGSNASGQSATAGADVDAPAGWEGTKGQDTVVAIVDTGFDSDHPDLTGTLWTNPTEACGSVDTNGNTLKGDCHGWNFYSNTADIDNGTYGEHGTTVSGVVAAKMNNGQGSTGLAPGAKLMPLVAGGGENIDLNLASKAIRYAADNGADVINASFGGVVTGTALTTLKSAVDYALAKGVVVVAAAGNDSGNRDTSLLYPASLTSPALLTVGSSNAVDAIAGHSAYGATNVDLFAPGELVATTFNDGGYRLVSGTSIAAPHVAAAAAMYVSLHPDATPAQVRDALLAGTDHLNSMTGKSVSGGRLSVEFMRGLQSADYVFSGMYAKPGPQHPVVKVTSTASSGAYSVRFGLAMLVEGEVWAVSDQQVTFAGQSAVSDQDGTVTFPLGTLDYLGSPTLEPTFTLGAGQFALTTQILRDGQPLTRPYAAPLIVDPAANPAPSDPGTPGTPVGGGGSGTGGSTPSPSPSTPTGGSTPKPSSSPSPTTPSGGSGTGGSTPSPSTPTGGSTPKPSSSPSPTTPSGGSSPSPSTPSGGSTPKPSSSPSPTTPAGGTGTGGSGTGGSGTGGSGTPDPSPSTPTGGSTPNPSSSPSPTTPSTPSGSDIARFDNVGAFKLTSISPVHVSTAGGQMVHITGTALEDGLSVRVGATGTANVIGNTGTGIAFLAPALIAGTYDVTVYSKAHEVSVLPDALVYTAPANPGTGGTGTGGTGDTGTGGTGTGGTGTGGTGTGGTGGTGTGDTGTGGTTPTPKPSASSTPKPTTPGGGSTPAPSSSPTPTGPGTGSDPAGTPQNPRATRTGPNGEHLVRNDALASLATLWSTNCKTSCTGVQV